MNILKASLRKRSKFFRKSNLNNISDDYSIFTSNKILEILESRRNQIVAKATISFAASSALIAANLQYLLGNKGLLLSFFSVIFSVISVLLSCVSMLSSLNIIKRQNRKKKQKKSSENIFFFGWLSKRSDQELITALYNMDKNKYLSEVTKQIISLSKNLDARYKSLNTTYRNFIIALLFFIISFLLRTYFGNEFDGNEIKEYFRFIVCK